MGHATNAMTAIDHPQTATPQCENGYLKIANELAEAFSHLQLSGYQWRVVWAILRQTYGWQRTRHRISITRFQQITGLDRRHAHKALKDLITRKIVAEIRNGNSITYGIQKDFSKWQSLPKSAPSAEIRNSTVAEIRNESVAEIGTHKRKKKIKERENPFSDFQEIDTTNMTDSEFYEYASGVRP